MTNETSDSRPMTIALSLYVYGEELDPNELATYLGVIPTRSRRRGEKSVTSTGHEVIQGIGMLEIASGSRSDVLSEHLRELTSKLVVDGESLRNFPGVTEAHLDVFVSCLFDKESTARCNFELTQDDVHSLRRLDVPTHFTVTFSDD